MKRGGRLKRTELRRKTRLRSGKGLEPGKPLERKTPLKRGGGMRRKPPRKPLFDDRALRRAWFERTIAAAPVVGGERVCPVCGEEPSRRNRLEAHHVTAVAAIKDHVKSLGLDELDAAELLARLRWDVRNGLPACQRCHARHTNAYRRIPVALVTETHWEFARELGLERLIEATYRV